MRSGHLNFTILPAKRWEYISKCQFFWACALKICHLDIRSTDCIHQTNCSIHHFMIWFRCYCTIVISRHATVSGKFYFMGEGNRQICEGGSVLPSKNHFSGMLFPEVEWLLGFPFFHLLFWSESQVSVVSCKWAYLQNTTEAILWIFNFEDVTFVKPTATDFFVVRVQSLLSSDGSHFRADSLR